MCPDRNDASIDRLDEHTRLEIVRRALQDHHARVLSWCPHPMRSGVPGSELYLVTGSAHCDDMEVPSRFVLKIFSDDGKGWQEGSPDPRAWNYWKREWLVYRTEWVRQLRGLVAPASDPVRSTRPQSGWQWRTAADPSVDPGHQSSSRLAPGTSVSSTAGF